MNFSNSTNMLSLSDAFPKSNMPVDAEALRGPVRAFIAEKLAGLPAREKARTWTGFDAEFSRALGERGWLGLTLPERYGGSGKDAFSRFVVVEELLCAGAPIAAHWIGDRQSGPLLLRFGTETQKQTYLPDICAGKSVYCIGMSEPNAGSDLAAVRTRAEPDGDGWRLSGSKIWTTYAHKSHYMIALVRTSGTSADRQAGLSQFIIDLALPGVTIRPIQIATGEYEFSEVFFDDVRLDADALVGEAGNGWAQVNAELAFERSGPERIYSSLILLNLWADHLRRSPKDADVVRLGKFLAELATLRSMSLSVTGRLAQNDAPIVEAALIKDLGTAFEQSIPADIADAVGSDPGSPNDQELMQTLAFLLQLSPAFSLRGGTREILRGMIARGLGLR